MVSDLVASWIDSSVDMSRAKLADCLGVTRQTIYARLKNDDWRFDELYKISQLSGITLDEMARANKYT